MTTRNLCLLAALSATLLLAGLACNAEPRDLAAGCQGQTASVDGTTYCVHRGEITETGFSCPQGMPHGHQLSEELAVCSKDKDMPEEHRRKIRKRHGDESMSAADTGPPNNEGPFDVGYPDGDDDGRDDKNDKPAADVGGPAFDVGGPAVDVGYADSGEKMDSDLIPDPVPTTFRLVNESGAEVGLSEAGTCSKAPWVTVKTNSDNAKLWFERHCIQCQCEMIQDSHCYTCGADCEGQLKSLAGSKAVTYQWDGQSRRERMQSGKKCMAPWVPIQDQPLTATFCWRSMPFGQNENVNGIDKTNFTCKEVQFNYGQKMVEAKISGSE